MQHQTGSSSGTNSVMTQAPQVGQGAPGRRLKVLFTALAVMALALAALSAFAFAAADGAAQPAGPAASKTLAPNGDGTYTLSLSVTGEASASSEASRANVVVIMDRSASMDKPSGTYDEHWHSLSKLDVEKQAADLLADSLRQYNTAEHPDAVQIALIDFGGTATLTQGATSDFDAYESAVDGVESNSNPSYDAGTNWEAALQLAKSTADGMASGDRANVPTYVVFVSDGLPTFRQTPVYTEAQLHNNSWNYYSTANYRTQNDRGWWNYTEGGDQYYYTSAAPYGQGNGDSNGNNYNSALDDAQSIVNSGYTLFTIAAYGDDSTNSRMTDLATQSGSGIDHNYNATDSESLTKAFSDISTLITHSLGFTNVELDDVLTAMTSATIRGGVDTSNVTYTQTSAEGTTSTWADAPAITVSGDNVNWDLSSIGSLENGVTYTASFKVWPSQGAYDLVAQLYNADDPATAYEALTDDQKSQIAMSTDEQGNVSFGLRTNTDDTAVSYTQTYTETMGSLPDGRTIGVTYHDTIDGITYDVVYQQNSDGTYTMTRTASGNAAIDNPDPMPLTASSMSVTKSWNDNDNPGRPGSVILNVLQDGQQFASVTLSADSNWTANVHIAPGLIANGETLEAGHEYTVAEDLGENPEALSHYELEQTPSHPMIVDGVLQASATDASAAVLRATNDLKGTLRVGKTVTADAGLTPSADAQFTYTVSLKDASGNALTDIPYAYQTSAATSETGTISNGGTFTLKADEHLTISDLPVGATYSVTETAMPSAYTFSQVEASAGVTTSADNRQASGTVSAASIATISFENAYHATPVTASIPVAKYLDYTDTATGVPSIQNAYTFTLTASAASPDAPLPATTSYTNPGTGNGTDGYGAHDGGTVTFSGITFTKPGSYAYAVTETGAVDGIANDATATKYVGVEVTDNGEGTLVATVYGAGGSATNPAAITFTNSYQMPASVALPVSKALQTIPSTLTAPDVQAKFTFTLQPDTTRYTDQTAVPMPAGSATSGGNVTYQLTNPLATGGNMSYPAISYTQAGTYYYTITETGSVDGVTNDVEPGTTTQLGGVRYVTVTVTEVEAAGSDVNDLQAKVQVYTSREAQAQGTGATDSAAFVNVYTAQPASVDFTVYKDLAADSTLIPPDILGKVTFTLHRETGSSLPMPGGATTDTVSTTNGTQVDADTTSGTFDAITFTEPGTYTYFVTESADIAGVSVQSVSHFVRVTVTDNGQGQLVAATRIDEQGGQLSFTNTYKVAPVSVTLNASKTLAYADDLTPASIAGKYTYTITADEADAPMPATTAVTNPGTGNGTGGYAAHDGGTASFGAITYTHPGTYHYHIAETGSAAGVTNDADTTRDVTVTVTDNSDGTMTAAVTGDLDVSASTANTVSFTNTYDLTQGISGAIPAVKVVASSNGLFTPDVTDKYTYTLAAVTDGAPMPATTTLTGPANAGTTGQSSVYASGTYTVPGTYQMGSFSDISFTRPGTYTYKVTESGSVSGITNDSAAADGKTVTATVTDNGDGTLSLALTDATGNAITASNPVSFTNTYQTPASTTVTIPVTKQISGDFNGDASRWFSFALSAIEGTPLPDDGVTTISNPSANGGTASYGAITYTRPGIYTYQVTESSDAHAGFTNDADNPKSVVVIVSDPQDGSGLTATLVGADSTFETNGSLDPADWTITEAKDSTTFTNTYEPAPATAQIPVTKVLASAAGATAPDITGKYTFTLTGNDNAPMPSVGGETVINPDANGGTASFGEISYSKPGTYTYTVTEAGSVPGVQNDQIATRTVQVEVTDDGTGALSAVVAGDATVTFTNTYYTPGELTGETAIAGTKTIEGRDMLEDEQFTFTLTPGDDATTAALADDTVVLGGDTSAASMNASVTGALDGSPATFRFGGIAFTEPGTYSFNVTENQGSAGGLTYDGATRTVTVTVERDSGSSRLVATANADDLKNLSFTNTYEASTQIDPPGAKALLGPDGTKQAISNGQFIFGLQYAQGDEKGTNATTGYSLAAEAGSDATIEFGQIDYTIAGLHELVSGGMATKGTDAAGHTTYTIPYNAVETSDGGEGVLPNRQVIGYVVTVTDDGAGHLSASAAIDGDAQTLAFTNYPSSVTATVDISGTKVLTGTRPLQAGDFSFTITGVDEDGNAAPLPENTRAENSASGAVDFGTITFEFDATEESVDKGGEVVGTGETEAGAAESSGQANADGAQAAQAGEGGTAAASVDGSASEDGAVSGTADESASSSEAADEDAAPSSAADAGSSRIPRGTSKTYTYTITESGTVPGVTNDTPKTFKVTVTRGDDGFLTVETSPDSAPLFTFSNTYQPTPGSSSVTSQIDVDKVLDGRDLATGEFTFTLAPTQVPEGAARPETVSGTNAADGTVTMPSVTFDRPGTYTFELTEDAGDAAYVTYDSVTYDVTARVTDACDGNPMSVEWTYGGGSSIIFENTYTPPTGPAPGPVPDPASGPGGSIIPSTGDGTVVPFAVFATLGVGLVVLGAVRRRCA